MKIGRAMAAKAKSMGLTISALAILIFFSLPIHLHAEDKPITLSEEDLILYQLEEDMMLGADDYFGEDADLAYADPVVPETKEGGFDSSKTQATNKPAPAPAAKPAPTGSGNDDDGDDGDDGDDDDGDDGDDDDDDDDDDDGGICPPGGG